MAVERGLAQLHADLRLGILFRWDGQPADPHEVRLVEIIATDGETVLASIDSFQHEAGSGEYFVTVPGELLSVVGRYRDRWHYTWIQGEGEQTAEKDFYVHEQTEPAHYGPPLQVGLGYLKGFPPLAPTAQDGVTQADLDAAMALADREIESAFAPNYEIGGWLGSTPPLVSTLWELLAASKAIEFRDLRLGASAGALARTSGGAAGASADTSPDCAALRHSARELLDRILHGRPDRLQLRDASGNPIRPIRNGAITVPRAKAPATKAF